MQLTLDGLLTPQAFKCFLGNIPMNVESSTRCIRGGSTLPVVGMSTSQRKGENGCRNQENFGATKKNAVDWIANRDNNHSNEDVVEPSGSECKLER